MATSAGSRKVQRVDSGPRIARRQDLVRVAVTVKTGWVLEALQVPFRRVGALAESLCSITVALVAGDLLRLGSMWKCLDVRMATRAAKCGMHRRLKQPSIYELLRHYIMTIEAVLRGQRRCMRHARHSQHQRRYNEPSVS